MSSENAKAYFREYKRKKRLDPVYRELENQRQRKYRELNKEKTLLSGRNSEKKRRLRRYNISELEYNQLFIKQGSSCAICGTQSPTTKSWHLDHCHKTNKVRGILCHHCNLMLGNAKDNIQTLENGILYLKGFSNE